MNPHDAMASASFGAFGRAPAHQGYAELGDLRRWIGCGSAGQGGAQ